MNNSAPDIKFNLDFVNGYTCKNARQNLYFGSNSDTVIYMAAAVGIVHTVSSNQQKFFGGGVVENTAKNVANDEKVHCDDITALSVSNDGYYVATGQVGASPVAFVWTSNG